MNLNANLPLDCHEFARLRFANSRNDEFLVILSLWRSIHLQSLTLWQKTQHKILVWR